jgi:hypothetical protein
MGASVVRNEGEEGQGGEEMQACREEGSSGTWTVAAIVEIGGHMRG